MDLAELQKQIGIDLSKIADDLEPVEGTYDFQMFTRSADGKPSMLKAFVEKDEETGEDDFIISGIASSTIKDHHGDTMLPSALLDMERAANDNLTIFLNHKYEVPKDIAGQVVKASITSSATDETGAPIYDLTFEKVRMNKLNKDAVETFQALQPKGKTPGVKLGFSIGARIPEGGAIRNKKTGALLIAHVLLLETSIVSLPANPRSWIENAVKSIRSGPTPLYNPAVAVTVNPNIVETNATTPVVETNASTTTVVVNSVATEAPTTPAEPEVTAASPSQGAPSTSEPGAEGAPAAPSVAAASEPPASGAPDQGLPAGGIEALQMAHDSLATVTAQLIDARRAQATAEERADTAERESKRIAAAAADVVQDALDIVDRIGRLPLGQKASFKAIARDAEALPASLGEVYSPGFMEHLKG